MRENLFLVGNAHYVAAVITACDVELALTEQADAPSQRTDEGQQIKSGDFKDQNHHAGQERIAMVI